MEVENFRIENDFDDELSSIKLMKYSVADSNLNGEMDFIFLFYKFPYTEAKK